MRTDRERRSVSRRLLDWFATNGRKNLPWQIDPTPYRVWVSEIMLQQTQVATVIPYYAKFMNAFPDVASLADASSDDVLHHWSGLGYYARARNLHKAARIVRDDYAGHFPHDFDAVVALPGIGRSTAGAILALADNQRHPILDGNVKRVLARFHAVPGWPGTASVARELWKLAEEHLPQDDVAAYTQAIMDFGAIVCTRSSPGCDACPLATDCAAHLQNRESEFPGRKPGSARPVRRTRMLMLLEDNAVLLERRPESGIWGGLWSLPQVDPDEDVRSWCQGHLGLAPTSLEEWELVRHSFTHFELQIEPVLVRLDSRSRTVADTEDQAWFDLDEPRQVGLAAPVAGLLDNLQSMK